MSTEVLGVHKSYGAVEALRGVDLTVHDGEFVAILGPSGCGKTTLLRILAGFEAPSAGEVRIDGQRVGGGGRSLPPERRNLGMVFQSFALWPHMSVAEHVRFALNHHRHLPPAVKADKEARLREVLQITGLSAYGDRMPHQLSGGQRQRVALARAIAPSPALLLMDEPLSSLDAALREEMRREIQDIHRVTGASIVYVTHDQTEALAMADTVVVMLDGRLEQVGSPRAVFGRPETEFVARFVGRANLVPGTWDGSSFLPRAGAGKVRWDGTHVAPGLRESGVFPARPDQLEPVPAAADGDVTGVVRNVLFAGRDVHYTIEVGDEVWEVVSPRQVGLGETVGLRLREPHPALDSAP